MNPDILTRVGYYQSGLLTQGQVRDLILDSVATHMEHLLPREVQDYARELVKRGELKRPIEAVN